jgi:hypothetical protein
MTTAAPITYRGFYDVPRMFVLRLRGAQLFFDCPFDDELDDYPDTYTVYRLPDALAVENVPSWYDLPAMGERLGRIPLAEVHFDPTRRRSVDLQPIEQYGERHGWW